MRRDRVVFAEVEELDVVHAVGVALVDRAREPGFATTPARLDGVADLVSSPDRRRRGDLLARGPRPLRRAGLLREALEAIEAGNTGLNQEGAVVDKVQLQRLVDVTHRLHFNFSSR